MSAAFSTPRTRAFVRQLPPMAIAVAALIVLLAWYVLATNAFVAMQYSISDASAARLLLGEEIETLETRLAEVTKPEALEAQANALGFMNIRNPRYLAVPGDAVARR